MGTDATNVDDTEVLRDRSGKRMRLFIAVISTVIIVTVVVSTYHFVDWSNGPAQVNEELNPLEYPNYDDEAHKALVAANTQLADMELGNVQPVDPDSKEFRVHLFHHHNWGFTYWKFHDDDTEILVNADTGEIFDCWSLAPHEEGPRLSEEGARTYVLELMSQFAPLPADMDPPRVHHSSWCMNEFLLPNGTWGSMVNYTDYDFVFNRSCNGIRTTDSIVVWMDVDGSLIMYSKEWFMDLEGFDTSHTVSAEEAKEAASAYLEREMNWRNVTFDLCEIRIVYPFDEDGRTIPGYDPVQVWRLECNRYQIDYTLHMLSVSCNGDAKVLTYQSEAVD
jgi:hypothetical protein